jgi:hypothetical protein
MVRKELIMGLGWEQAREGVGGNCMDSSNPSWSLPASENPPRHFVDKIYAPAVMSVLALLLFHLLMEA